ncbi:mitochondrial import inner membrane translocase subunit Tim8 [Copidosoma floridanum]|uniref:mitochondrial import inner membrane translocase subunit Tim8 n=1 Tax=Copidosoma floridanum TaxID=29053 RepID=UPI0006C9C6B7|nr:mitochondrial import inner membrane translocase subunit Tim8 [Copidosoma floridanum]
MTDLFNSSSNFDAPAKDLTNEELKEFIMVEQQKAQLNARVREFSDLCWDRCIDKPSNKLDGRTETCLNNCVNRFIDVSLLITSRFAQMMQKNA